MVENLAPKISDVKSLKDLAQVFAIPMVVIAYFFQTGAQISFGENVFLKLDTGSSENQLLVLLLIFLMKALFSGWIAIAAYAIFGLVHIFTGKVLLYALAPMCFSFALFGLFGLEKYPLLKTIEVFWFYALIVWGFTFLGMCNQFEDSPRETKLSHPVISEQPYKSLGS